MTGRSAARVAATAAVFFGVVVGAECRPPVSGPRASAWAQEGTPDGTTARVEELAADLATADPAVRARATKALTEIGAAAILPLLDEIPGDPASKHGQAVLDALAAIDVEQALAEILCRKSEWRERGWWSPPRKDTKEAKDVPDPGPRGRGRPPRRTDARDGPRLDPRDTAPRQIDLILAHLRGKRRPDLERSALLEPSRIADPFVVPPFAEEALTGAAPSAKTLPESLAGFPYAIREKDGALEVDVTKTARYAVRVEPDAPQVLELGARKPFRSVLVFRRAGRWLAAPAASFTARIDGIAAEFVDGDGDGALDGPSDLVRFDGGAFRRATEEPLARTPGGVVRWRVRPATAKDLVPARSGGDAGDGRPPEGKAADAKDRLVVVWAPEPEPAWRTDVQARMLDELNRWRQAIGLPPQRVDRRRSEHCELHHTYWRLNGFSGHDEYPSGKGFSKEGAVAGKASSVTNSPDGPRFVRDIFWTLLHRNSCVTHPMEGIGAFAGPVGGLLWGGDQDALARGFPILVPGPGTTGVPVLCEPEIPVPDRLPRFYEQKRGAPISVTWSGLRDPRWQDLRKLRVELWKGAAEGPSLPGTLFSKEFRYKEDFAAGFPEESAIFVSDTPFEPESRYTVRFSAEGRAGPVSFAWEFWTE